MTQEDQCPICKTTITEDMYITGQESHEFWGTPCHETIVIGFKCGNCDHEEMF